jgi:putative flavoprotein involved in K+ transport
LSRRGSAFIWGVWHDAKHIADHIITQRKYLAYYDGAQPDAQHGRDESGDNTSGHSPVHKISAMG